MFSGGICERQLHLQLPCQAAVGEELKCHREYRNSMSHYAVVVRLLCGGCEIATWWLQEYMFTKSFHMFNVFTFLLYKNL